MIMLVSVAVLSFSCDPLEDDIKAIEANKVEVQDLVYTLVEDDYDFADDICECSGFGSFGSDDDVKVNVPLVLNENFPALGKGSSAIITYQFFNGSSPDLRGEFSEFTATDADYDALGFRFPNFGNLSEDVPEFAELKKPDARDGDHMDITHDFFSGATGFVSDSVSRAVYTVSNGWQYAWIVPQEVYDFFGESSTEYPDDSGNFTPDFSYDDEASEKLPIYLNNKFENTLFAEEGDVLVVQFNFDNGADNEVENPTEQDVILYIFNGTGWTEYGDGFQTAPQTLSFGHDGATWVPDNTIKYTFSAADFTVAGDDANALGNAAARDNLRSFGNFGTDWSREEILVAIGFVLKLNFPDAEVGQKYLVTYNTFPAGDLSALFILDASGDYIEVVE